MHGIAACRSLPGNPDTPSMAVSACEKCCFGDVNNKYCVFTQRIIPSEWNLGFAAMKKRQDGEEK